jgi:ATP-dependent helicase YprA (DUF1998 family)/very-short-patch-repair endonuclease
MDVFDLRRQLINSYADYIRSFIHIRDPRVASVVNTELGRGLLWPEPLIQLNPAFEAGAWIDDLVREGVLQEECSRIFRAQKGTSGQGRRLRLHRHQEEAVRVAGKGHHYVLTTGTGSGKSLAYIVPIVNHVLEQRSGRGIRAIVVYPMNALANSQEGELRKFLCDGYPDGRGPVTFACYTGQESDQRKNEIIADPPDILLTNYVMLELILTRPREHGLIEAAKGLRFLVLDELHTYRGRQGSDVSLLARRVRETLQAGEMLCVGTSATLAGTGTFDEQRSQVAQVASQVFGAEVRPDNVIGETLKRATPDLSTSDPVFLEQLTSRVEDTDRRPPSDYREFVVDPLSIWIESTFGLEAESPSGRLRRARPKSLSGPEGAARQLSLITGVDEGRCVAGIEQALLGGYECTDPDTLFPAFAFRLHQFISRGDTVYASPEREDERFITLQAQHYVPNDRRRVLLPLVFCRECGQEYYSVRITRDQATGRRVLSPRDLGDAQSTDESETGFLHISREEPWPGDPELWLDRLPDDWLEERNGILRVRRDRQDHLPEPIQIGLDGTEDAGGLHAHIVPAPFRFCLCCSVSYGFRLTSDFTKLSTLSSEGRSTATTILSLSAIRSLRTSGLDPTARKLLSFTDNRQDASLQAGHFNDFVEIGLLRGALYRAVAESGPEGIAHEALTQKVFASLNLDPDLYAVDPTVRFAAAAETKRALRDVLGYRLYRDLRRGWRVTSPNLEQCGLLRIEYQSLDELCASEDVWHDRHPALSTATPQVRSQVAKVLLDFMRRELAMKVDYLDPAYQERIQQQSSQKLKEPWGIDESEGGRMEYASILFPRPQRGGRDDRANLYLSPRGGYGQFLGRPSTFPNLPGPHRLEDKDRIIRDVLECLRVAGLVEIVVPTPDPEEVPGYQIPASALRWTVGDGIQAFHDPIRVPNRPADGGRTNPFFVDFYRTLSRDLNGLMAREHTAQVPNAKRIEREEDFREGKLPILYCSPTMELGVDIAALNVVNMRNVPPTPANYAQRSGRAGRSGQPALVYTYCSTGSPHDQYFFKRPDRMVSGAVSPPRLDLTNEDLVRAHVHGIWLAETKQDLGRSLRDLLDVAGERPGLGLLDHVRDCLGADAARRRARLRADRVLATFRPELEMSGWFNGSWLDEALEQALPRFDKACDRWRGLYRAALSQREVQNKIIGDASRPAPDKERAKRLRQEAESQLELLTETSNIAQSDFYSYRYFASEGFLPGYNFPRLPLSAYIPGRRARQGRDEFLSRPRFLAISEFGPRSIIYHEGSRYLINRVILPVDERDLLTEQAKLCQNCGYLHPILGGIGPDLCERCHNAMGMPLAPLFRLQNVSTKRRDRISSDEEERRRLGYEIITGVRFSEREGSPTLRTAGVELDGETLLDLHYGPAATLWRINKGENRRRNRNELGFALDLERGYWGRSEQVVDDQDDADPLSGRVMRVIPYVEDHRNALLLQFHGPADIGFMASLQAALKSAIQVQYQLEDSELAAEPLPSRDDRRLILLYESAEGGAGVLRRLVDDPAALGLIARRALDICHFDPTTGEDQRRAPRSREDCEAACYDCLMNYANQPDHAKLDRKQIRDVLLQLAAATVLTAPNELTRPEHLDRLLRLAGSDLERSWVRYIDGAGLRLPTKAQELFASCGTRPDFSYDDHHAVIYVDGPHHDYPERSARDAIQTERMEDMGITVIRFGYTGDWDTQVARYPHIFGRPK